jgi:hypothetical protein
MAFSPQKPQLYPADLFMASVAKTQGISFLIMPFAQEGTGVFKTVGQYFLFTQGLLRGYCRKWTWMGATSADYVKSVAIKCFTHL